jgi:hypothetical protein
MASRIAVPWSQSMRSAVLHDFFGPLLEDRFHFTRELIRQGAVGQAVVEG